MRDIKPFRSHGSGAFRRQDFKRIGKNVILEPGVLVFHPETIEIGSNVYVGHRAILKGYHKGSMVIGDHVWIGQNAFLHSAGGIVIGNRVGIGPGVTVLTSSHADESIRVPILFSDLEFAPVVVEEDSDLGVGAIVMPGVTVGRGSQIGAGAVVTKHVPPYSVVAGVPGRVLRKRR
jgi:acetyltransferase-like isoleucine patch superfamily enzyme